MVDHAPPAVPLARIRGPHGVLDVAAAGVLLPGLGVREPADLRRHPGDAWEFDPHALLGRKGVRYKDRATLLASAVCEAAVGRPALRTLLAGQGTALVVASCYGNAATVCAVSEQIAADGVAATSPMDLPNASSNVVAAALAIRFGVTGVCLTVCNGHGSGWDALLWADRLLAAGRARRVLVVGVETPSDAERRVRGGQAPPLVDGAAAVLLTRGDPGAAAAAPAGALDVAWSAVEWAAVAGVVDAVRAAAAPVGTGAPPAAVTIGGTR